MKKLTLVQLSPESTGYGVFDDLGDWEDIRIFGNKDFVGIDNIDDGAPYEEFEWLIQTYLEVRDTGDASNGFYEDETEVLSDYLRGFDWKDKEKEIKELIEKLDSQGDEMYKLYDEYYLELLNLLTGKKYELVCIRGCSQSDWQYLIYNTEIHESETIEGYYFNLGDEYTVIETDADEEVDIDSIFDYECYSYYTLAWKQEDLIEEVKAGYGEDTLVEIYEFDRYMYVPQYKKVI